MENYNIAQALEALYPGSIFRVENIDDIEIDVEIDIEAVKARVQVIQTEYDNQQYQRDRQYPSLEEQADMAYWDRKNGTTTLDDALDAVKAEFPKPTE